MADEHRRELGRQAAQGDIQAQAQLLRERVRAGDLEEVKLGLAAHLGHRPSLIALGRDTDLAVENYQDWINGIHLLPRDLIIAVLIAVSEIVYRETLGRGSSADGIWNDRAIEELLSLSKRWLADPSVEVENSASDCFGNLILGHPASFMFQMLARIFMEDISFGGATASLLEMSIMELCTSEQRGITELHESRLNLCSWLQDFFVPWLLGHDDTFLNRVVRGGFSTKEGEIIATIDYLPIGT